jgi:hypothetical protein
MEKDLKAIKQWIKVIGIISVSRFLFWIIALLDELLM